MSKFIKLLQVTVVSASVALLSSCANKIQKAEISNDADPQQEVAQLEESMAEGYNSHADVLAPKDFEKAKKYTEKAKDDLADGDDREDILENVAYARAYLDQAMSTTQSRSEKVSGVIDARTSAITAGARGLPSESKRLTKADNELREASDDIDSELTTDDISRLQSIYLGIENTAIREKHLSSAKAKVQAAVDAGAKKRTPQTLRKAEVDINSAANLIAANPHNPERYQGAVEQANYSAQYLYEVIQASVDGGPKTSESVAIQLVDQRRAISARDRTIGSLSSDLDTRNMTLSEREAALRAQRAQVAIQAALESARREFTPAEAEAYQQGDKLIIRLKSMNFATNRADLPPQSMPLLDKVNNVVSELNTSNLVVEGHTDSIGSTEVNQKLSQARAESVAQYLQKNSEYPMTVDAIGMGFQKPIASNKSASGRAQNRRVDVIVTAGDIGAMQDRTPASTDEMENHSPAKPNKKHKKDRM